MKDRTKREFMWKLRYDYKKASSGEDVYGKDVILKYYYTENSLDYEIWSKEEADQFISLIK